MHLGSFTSIALAVLPMCACKPSCPLMWMQQVLLVPEWVLAVHQEEAWWCVKPGPPSCMLLPGSMVGWSMHGGGACAGSEGGVKVAVAGLGLSSWCAAVDV